MAITAAQVKELRESTGAGMMDAKKALTETDGDMDAAVDWLRTKGLAKAAKKSGRTAAEGLVAVAAEGGTAVAVEVNSETDFVAKNAEFQEMVSGIARAALAADDVEALLAADLGGKTVEQTVTDKIATIGENMGVRRMAKLGGESVVSYVHNAAAPGMGKIGVLVAFNGARRGLRPAGRHACGRREPRGARTKAELDPSDRGEGKAGPDGHRPRKRQARAGDREDDRRPDEEIPGRRSRWSTSNSW
jgi:elongation factor Ts